MIRIILLVLLAAAQAVHAQGQRVYDVKTFGAAGDGVALDTASINKAIDACAAAGGGTVYFPAGTYLSGTIRLKDHVTLRLDSGATLLGSKNLGDYESAVDGNAWYDALVLAKDVSNIAIIGHGAIDGNSVRNPKGEEHIRGPHALLLYNVQNAAIRDISIQDSGNYSLIIRSAAGVNVNGLTVHGGWDGINMWDTHDATISNCRIYSGDDSLAGRYWENVTVTNCILNAGANGIRVGGRNVLFSDSVIYGPAKSVHLTSLRHHTEAGFQILPNGSGSSNKFTAAGPVDNMVLSNLTMINVGTPFYVAYSKDAPYSDNNLGVGRIIVNNLTALGAGKAALYISAPPHNPAKSIIFNDVRISFAGGSNESQSEGQGFSPFSVLQSSGLYARNVTNLELHDVHFDYAEPDKRPAIFGENIGTLLLDRFHAARAPGGAPPIEGQGIDLLIIDGKEAPVAQAQVTGLATPQNSVFAGEPFELIETVDNSGTAGLASVPLRLGNQPVSRSVWLDSGERAQLTFVNLRAAAPGDLEVQAGPLTKTLNVTSRPAGHPPAPPYQAFENAAAKLLQLGDDTFYIRADGDYPVMQYGDQYGSIYLPRGLPRDATVVVRLDNPDLVTNWQGRAGIIVRDDIAKPGQSSGYLILSSSPAAGTYLEWDDNGRGMLDAHTEFAGNTIWPHWLKLERHGSRFTGYSSDDGSQWTQIGQADVLDVNDSLDVGIFAFRSSALFEDFTVTRQSGSPAGN